MKHRIPMLKDHHSHPYLYASLLEAIDLRGAKTKREAFHLLDISPHDFKIAYGWDDSRYSFTSNEIEHLQPIAIVNTSLHRFLLNAASKKLLVNSPADILDNHDNPQWVERNFARVLKFIMELNRLEGRQLSHYFEFLLTQGVWHTEEMSLLGAPEIEMLSADNLFDRTSCWTDLETYRNLKLDLQKNVRGIKLFADGSLGAKTAALNGKYLGGERGFLNYTEEELITKIGKVSALNKPLSIHAVGGAAISLVIHVLDTVRREHGIIPETRIEHCQFISWADAIKAKSLGIILSMQPNFSSESIVYSDRLPLEWCLANNPFRMLIDDAGFIPGKDLLLGSDGMPAGAKEALQFSLFPPFPSQRMDLDEFSAAYCMPDEQPGWIDVDIDESRKSVRIDYIQVSN